MLKHIPVPKLHIINFTLIVVCVFSFLILQSFIGHYFPLFVNQTITESTSSSIWLNSYHWFIGFFKFLILSSKSNYSLKFHSPFIIIIIMNNMDRPYWSYYISSSFRVIFYKFMLIAKLWHSSKMTKQFCSIIIYYSHCLRYSQFCVNPFVSFGIQPIVFKISSRPPISLLWCQNPNFGSIKTHR